MRKRVEDLASGDQIITESGRRDRVHGVNRDTPGTVRVHSDANREAEYEEGVLVDVV